MTVPKITVNKWKVTVELQFKRSTASLGLCMNTSINLSKVQIEPMKWKVLYSSQLCNDTTNFNINNEEKFIVEDLHFCDKR